MYIGGSSTGPPNKVRVTNEVEDHGESYETHVELDVELCRQEITIGRPPRQPEI